MTLVDLSEVFFCCFDQDTNLLKLNKYQILFFIDSFWLQIESLQFNVNWFCNRGRCWFLADRIEVHRRLHLPEGHNPAFGTCLGIPHKSSWASYTWLRAWLVCRLRVIHLRRRWKKWPGIWVKDRGPNHWVNWHLRNWRRNGRSGNDGSASWYGVSNHSTLTLISERAWNYIHLFCLLRRSAIPCEKFVHLWRRSWRKTL